MYMEILLQIFTPAIMLVMGLFGGGDVQSHVVQDINSVELGLSELSPRGPGGGFAMPASGCSSTHFDEYIHECGSNPEIDVSPFIIRAGETATVTWNTNGLANCELIGNLASAGPVGYQGSTGNSAIDTPNTGSEDVSPNADTTYYISCPGTDGEDSALLRVLPRIQET